MKMPEKSILDKAEQARARDKKALAIMARRDCTISEAYLEVLTQEEEDQAVSKIGPLFAVR